MPSGRELSDEERIFSGLGFGLGAIGDVWRGVAAAGALPPTTIRIAGKIADVDDVLVKGFQVRRLRAYKTLRGAVTEQPLYPFEKTAAKFLSRDGRTLLGVGDDGVRATLWPKLARDARTKPRAPDFITVSAQNKLILSEVKGGVNIDGKEVIEQLSSGMEGVRQNGLVGDVEEVQLLMERGGKFGGTQFIAQDGYLFDTQKGKRATLKGFNMPIKVIRL
ncbi:hypothetical protein BE04_13540 [Sorangium cellulosum]|uniref:Uncharacterized protein n=1 Tax=Sorangium cellulosum TaxID=56 RepID=A0A150P3E4_SORCE|nr:hypothetical protein BE04_13540 [Sorangium cellulosum]